MSLVDQDKCSFGCSSLSVATLHYPYSSIYAAASQPTCSLCVKMKDRSHRGGADDTSLTTSPMMPTCHHDSTVRHKTFPFFDGRFHLVGCRILAHRVDFDGRNGPSVTGTTHELKSQPSSSFMPVEYRRYCHPQRSICK